MPTSEELQAAIADAVRIVREDKFEGWLRSRFPEPADPSGPQPPPAKDPAPEPEPGTKSKGVWWRDLPEDAPEPTPEPPKE
jgi:hypothetical protein